MMVLCIGIMSYWELAVVKLADNLRQNYSAVPSLACHTRSATHYSLRANTCCLHSFISIQMYSAFANACEVGVRDWW